MIIPALLSTLPLLSGQYYAIRPGQDPEEARREWWSPAAVAAREAHQREIEKNRQNPSTPIVLNYDQCFVNPTSWSNLLTDICVVNKLNPNDYLNSNNINNLKQELQLDQKGIDQRISPIDGARVYEYASRQYGKTQIEYNEVLNMANNSDDDILTPSVSYEQGKSSEYSLTFKTSVNVEIKTKILFFVNQKFAFKEEIDSNTQWTSSKKTIVTFPSQTVKPHKQLVVKNQTSTKIYQKKGGLKYLIDPDALNKRISLQKNNSGTSSFILGETLDKIRNFHPNQTILNYQDEQIFAYDAETEEWFCTAPGTWTETVHEMNGNAFEYKI